jgi:hypothetical protein
MKRNFTEAVFEGDYNTIRGYIEGFIAATGREFHFFICSESGIEPETLTEHIREWISLGTRLHHVLMEDELLDGIRAALSASGDKGLAGRLSLRSSTPVKGASFRFRFITYGRKYAEEIKELFGRLPEGVTLDEYSPVEKVDDECKGVELYTPCHEYVFQGKGVISGGLDLVIPLRGILDAHPLIEAEKIKLDL